jgi:hypothetical protein
VEAFNVSLPYQKFATEIIQYCSTENRVLLNNIDDITITVDVWTDRRGKAFLGVTAHFIDENYSPHALLLDFVRLVGSHTGENIRNVTEEILGNLNVSNAEYYRYTH